ncbi:MAG: choice-of-anchor tandem repeat GloVer-containing protein [Candidatus Sulfotelmatobacter sp.]
MIHYFNFGQGSYPEGTPTFDSKGYLYGTTYEGGLHNGGVAYRLAPPATEGEAWTYKVLYAFRGTATDGYSPNGGLTLHGRNALYGTSVAGGQYGLGTVFQLVPPTVAGGAWTENILYNFANQNDGVSPVASVIFDKAGNLYGITWYGGGNGSGICFNGGCGIVFDLSPPATEGANWTETVLHSFPASAKDGSSPSGGVIFGKNGVLFGVTELGGAGGQGAVFGLIP